MKQKSEAPFFTTVECGRCAVCCTEPVVPVTGSDIKRICAAVELPPERIVRFYSDKEMEYDHQAGLWIRFPQGKRAMGLRKRLSRCMFLDDHKNCTIYNHRPMTCRTFPYDIELDESGNPQKVKLNRIVNCHCKRKPESRLSGIIDDVRIERSNDDLYYDLIEIWNNSRPLGTTREFLRFVVL